MYLSDIASEGFYSPSRGTRNGPGSTRDVDSIAGGQAPRRSSHAYHDHASPSSPAPPTSIPLDDSFDAYTTEVPTEWAVGDRHAEYERDESVSGYRNYVTEMERMLSGQMENAARIQERQDGYRAHGQQDQDYDRLPHRGDPELEEEQSQAVPHTRTHARPERSLRRSEASVSESARGSSRSRLGDARRRGVGQQPLAASMQAPKSQPSPLPPMSPPPDNARQVRGKKGQVELVEQRILEDTPARTISIWRERVAQSVSGSGSAFDDELRSETDSHAHAHAHTPRQGHGGGLGHRRVLSGSVASDARLRRMVSEHTRYPSPLDGGGLRNGSVRGTDNGKAGRASYERSEYMVSYQQATKGGLSQTLSPRSEAGSAAAFSRDLRTPSSPTLSRVYERTPPSPTLRRHVPRKSLDRNEYMMTYPQTPPRSGSQASSAGPAPLPKGTNGGGNGIGQGASPRSPRQNSFREDGGSVLRATSTSSVEIILSSCDPSLLHIAPALYELGIKRVDHLRAIARLSEETRDREVKEQALKRGVTVVEWAIFLDRLQSL
ncbi:hypothetical protein C8Q80DRAFT_391255 [Daedaleopsis nitida]|nr:hypothetical protein C8Q80DRAFT_391255 [Daedaleopsis nitida]